MSGHCNGEMELFIECDLGLANWHFIRRCDLLLKGFKPENINR